MSEGPLYRYYVLGAVVISGILNIADRLILSILMEDIKAEFAFTDTQVGVIQGFAFTVFYVIFGIPIAWLADRKNRKTIVAVSIASWSLMTALCGAAVGFWSLFIARMGVGIGESGSGPANLSIIADYFRKHELGRAMGVTTLGATLGTAVGLMAGGYFADLLGWRMAFLALGIPGIIYALIFYLTVREPERGRYFPGEFVAPKQESFWDGLRSWVETLKDLSGNHLYVGITLAYSFMTVIGYAFASWLAMIALRNFDVSIGEVGFYLGLAFVLGGIPGPLVGGFLTDYLVRLNPKWRGWLPAIATLACLPIYYVCLTSASFSLFLGFFALGYLTFLIAQAPTMSLLQLAVRPDQRAMAVAIALLFNNLIAQALGAYLIGLTSTNLSASFGPMSLSFAVLGVSSVFGVLAAILYVWTANRIRSDFETA